MHAMTLAMRGSPKRDTGDGRGSWQKSATPLTPGHGKASLAACVYYLIVTTTKHHRITMWERFQIYNVDQTLFMRA